MEVKLREGEEASMVRLWLWLEDQEETVEDYAQSLRGNFEVERFTVMDRLIERLLELKERSDPRLETAGFILDVMISNSPVITCPTEWSGGPRIDYFWTNRGYDAGIVFYEKFILSQVVESGFGSSGPPPVVFLTVRQLEVANIEVRFLEIRRKWAELSGISVEKAQVEWLRKWRTTGNRLSELMEKWEKDDA